MMNKKHRLTLFQKKLRSITKRFFVNLINKSDSYLVQHIPEFVGNEDIHFEILRKIWTAENNKNNNSDLVRLLFLISNIQEIVKSDIPGSFAELGVYKGNSAKILHSMAPSKKLFLFDTFKGFTEQDINSDMKKKINPKHFLDTSLEKVKKFISPNENVIFCPGYFPETLSYVPENESFSFVHLDADLYLPTKHALEYFYPRLVNKGILIIHDYFSGAWPGVTQAVDEFFIDKKENIIRIPDKSGSVVIRKSSF